MSPKTDDFLFVLEYTGTIKKWKAWNLVSRTLDHTWENVHIQNGIEMASKYFPLHSETSEHSLIVKKYGLKS